MVDALRRAQQMVTPAGVVVDVHPTAVPAAVWVADRQIGDLDAADAPARHAAADAAVHEVLAARLFHEIISVEFQFTTYADTIDELRDHIAAHWRNTRIDPETVSRAREAVAVANVRPGVREHVRLTILRPLAEEFERHG